MIQRLLDARASLPPEKGAAITAMLNSLNLGIDFTPTPRVLKTHVFGPSHTPPTLEHVASLFSPSSGGPPKFSKVLVLTGAGVSVAAGIPDFRTPGTGLYDNLEKYNLPHPTAVFDLDFYRSNPVPFVTLAKEIWPGEHMPTMTHAFIKLLSDKGVLLRNYTQNIDGLEVLGGVPEDKVVECHGHFRTASCTNCGAVAEIGTVAESIVGRAEVPVCESCGGYVKPDIVFFGEDLPGVFHNNIQRDAEEADLLIVIGTSLQVHPVAGIPDFVGEDVPRLLFNRELVGNFDTSEYNYRDVYEGGDCDGAVTKFCGMVGWEDDLSECYESAEVRKRAKEKESIRSKEEVD